MFDWVMEEISEAKDQAKAAFSWAEEMTLCNTFNWAKTGNCIFYACAQIWMDLI